jgi:hypothetical protein
VLVLIEPPGRPLFWPADIGQGVVELKRLERARGLGSVGRRLNHGPDYRG